MAVFQLRLNDEVDNKLKFIAENQQRSKNKQIEYIINMFVKDYEKVNGEIKIKERN